MNFEFKFFLQLPFIKYITPKTLIDANILSVTQVIITYYNTNITKLCKQCKKAKFALCAREFALCANLYSVLEVFLIKIWGFLKKNRRFHEILHCVQILTKKDTGE